jgi:HAE1 family hydrophobic/amphiphilic exporter-1
MIQVTTTYRGAAAEAVMESVATPIESKVNGVDKLALHAVLQRQRRQAHAERVLRRRHRRGHHAGQRAEPVGQAEAQLPDAVKREGVVVNRSSPDILMVIALNSPKAVTTPCSRAITATSTSSIPSSA